MIVYISGPITGIPNAEHSFRVMAEEMRERGHIVINPWDAMRGSEGVTQEQYMRFHIQTLLTAEMIVMLDGWERSKGASFERHMAEVLGIPICSAEEFA